MSRNTPSTHEPWDACPAGEISHMVGDLRRQDRRKALRTMALASSSVLLGGAGVYFAGTAFKKPPGGLTCDEVQAKLPRYVSGKLPEKVRRQIDIHLEACPHCRKAREQLI